MRSTSPATWLLLGSALASAPCSASDLELLTAGVQVRVGERRVIGKRSPESFEEYDFTTSWRTPWAGQPFSWMSVGARVLANVGVFEGTGKTAAVASVVPMLAFSTPDNRFAL